MLFYKQIKQHKHERYRSNAHNMRYKCHRGSRRSVEIVRLGNNDRIKSERHSHEANDTESNSVGNRRNKHNTKQKLLILEAVRSVCTHPTAEQVHEMLADQMPGLSLGTVYRNLKQFVEDGRAITLETTDMSLHYDGRVASHGHFVCEHCGKTIDVFESFALPHTLVDSGVKISDTKVIFYGTCADCLKNTN